MSRLIDADALKTKIEQSGGEGTIARYCKRVLAECLDNDAPTIDAIPVEWLREWQDEVGTINEWWPIIERIITVWREEQEART